MLATTIDPARVSRWGNSLAVRIPARLARQVDLAEGSAVELTVEDKKLVIVSAEPEAPRFDLAQLIAGMTQENIHDEVDLGDSIGAEII